MAKRFKQALIFKMLKVVKNDNERNLIIEGLGTDDIKAIDLSEGWFPDGKAEWPADESEQEEIFDFANRIRNKKTEALLKKYKKKPIQPEDKTIIVGPRDNNLLFLLIDMLVKKGGDADYLKQKGLFSIDWLNTAIQKHRDSKVKFLADLKISRKMLSDIGANDDMTVEVISYIQKEDKNGKEIISLLQKKFAYIDLIRGDYKLEVILQKVHEEYAKKTTQENKNKFLRELIKDNEVKCDILKTTVSSEESPTRVGGIAFSDEQIKAAVNTIEITSFTQLVDLLERGYAKDDLSPLDVNLFREGLGKFMSSKVTDNDPNGIEAARRLGFKDDEIKQAQVEALKKKRHELSNNNDLQGIKNEVVDLLQKGCSLDVLRKVYNREILVDALKILHDAPNNRIQPEEVAKFIDQGFTEQELRDAGYSGAQILAGIYISNSPNFVMDNNFDTNKAAQFLVQHGFTGEILFDFNERDGRILGDNADAVQAVLQGLSRNFVDNRADATIARLIIAGANEDTLKVLVNNAPKYTDDEIDAGLKYLHDNGAALGFKGIIIGDADANEVNGNIAKLLDQGFSVEQLEKAGYGTKLDELSGDNAARGEMLKSIGRRLDLKAALAEFKTNYIDIIDDDNIESKKIADLIEEQGVTKTELEDSGILTENNKRSVLDDLKGYYDITYREDVLQQAKLAATLIKAGFLYDDFVLFVSADKAKVARHNALSQLHKDGFAKPENIRFLLDGFLSVLLDQQKAAALKFAGYTKDELKRAGVSKAAREAEITALNIRAVLGNYVANTTGIYLPDLIKAGVKKSILEGWIGGDNEQKIEAFREALQKLHVDGFTTPANVAVLLECGFVRSDLVPSYNAREIFAGYIEESKSKKDIKSEIDRALPQGTEEARKTLLSESLQTFLISEGDILNIPSGFAPEWSGWWYFDNADINGALQAIGAGGEDVKTQEIMCNLILKEISKGQFLHHGFNRADLIKGLSHLLKNKPDEVVIQKIKNLKSKGFDIDMFLEAGATKKELEDAKVKASEINVSLRKLYERLRRMAVPILIRSGFLANDLLFAGYLKEELNAMVAEVITPEFKPYLLNKESGWVKFFLEQNQLTVDLLKDAGITAFDLKNLGIEHLLQQLLDSKDSTGQSLFNTKDGVEYLLQKDAKGDSAFKVKDLVEAEVKPEALNEAGIYAIDFKDGTATNAAEFMLAEMRDITLEDIRDNRRFHTSEGVKFLREHSAYKDEQLIKEAEISKHLVFAKKTHQQLLEAGLVRDVTGFKDALLFNFVARSGTVPPENVAEIAFGENGQGLLTRIGGGVLTIGFEKDVKPLVFGANLDMPSGWKNAQGQALNEDKPLYSQLYDDKGQFVGNNIPRNWRDLFLKLFISRPGEDPNITAQKASLQKTLTLKKLKEWKAADLDLGDNFLRAVIKEKQEISDKAKLTKKKDTIETQNQLELGALRLAVLSYEKCREEYMKFTEAEKNATKRAIVSATNGQTETIGPQGQETVNKLIDGFCEHVDKALNMFTETMTSEHKISSGDLEFGKFCDDFESQCKNGEEKTLFNRFIRNNKEWEKHVGEFSAATVALREIEYKQGLVPQVTEFSGATVKPKVLPDQKGMLQRRETILRVGAGLGLTSGRLLFHPKEFLAVFDERTQKLIIPGEAGAGVGKKIIQACKDLGWGKNGIVIGYSDNSSAEQAVSIAKEAIRQGVSFSFDRTGDAGVSRKGLLSSVRALEDLQDKVVEFRKLLQGSAEKLLPSKPPVDQATYTAEAESLQKEWFALSDEARSGVLSYLHARLEKDPSNKILIKEAALLEVVNLYLYLPKDILMVDKGHVLRSYLSIKDSFVGGECLWRGRISRELLKVKNAWGYVVGGKEYKEERNKMQAAVRNEATKMLENLANSGGYNMPAKHYDPLTNLDVSESKLRKLTQDNLKKSAPASPTQQGVEEKTGKMQI